MAGTSGTLVDHPVADRVAGARAGLTDLAEAPVWSLDAPGTRQVLRELAALESQVVELRARLLTHGREVEIGAESGARSPGHWLAHATQATKRSALAEQHLADRLARHPLTRQALRRGKVRSDQARAICDAVDDLPDDVADPSLRERAEKELLRLAADFDAVALKRLGRHVLEVVDPARADEYEARLLERQEREAERRTSFSVTDRGDGTHDVRGRISDLHASILTTVLFALAAPKHVNATGGAGSHDYERPSRERLGHAFCELLERYPVEAMPHSGGVTAQVVVTIPLAALDGGDECATLSTGVRISPGLARRLACEAGIIPMVLGGESQVLDVGRAARFHTRSMRLARMVEQPTCAHATCDVPAARCHAHHRTEWSRGGGTSKDHLDFYCAFHHAAVHRRE